MTPKDDNGRRSPTGGQTAAAAETDREKILQVKDLRMWFPINRGVMQRHVGDVKAVDGISFDIFKGETLGLVGESG